MRTVSQTALNQAQNLLNTMIEIINQEGGGLYLVSKNNPELSFELTDEVKLVCWSPLTGY